MKCAVALALLLACAAAADARSLLQGAKVKCTAGCLPGMCSADGKKCTACADGYVLKPSSGQCVCPDGTGSWADQTYETLAGFPASAPNCGVLPAEACKCQACPEGYAQAGAGSIPDAVCKPVPVDCVATYEAFADCPAESCQATLTQTANLLAITTEAKYGGQECAATISRDCTYETPLDCTPASTCQVSTCGADGTCSAPTNLDAGTVCTTADSADGICDGAGACIENVACVGDWAAAEGAVCAVGAGSCVGTLDEVFTVTTAAAGAGPACEAGDGEHRTVACNATAATVCSTVDTGAAGTCDAAGTCVADVDCVGTWADTDVCVIAEGACSGVHQQVFTVTTAAVGNGACPGNGATQDGTTDCTASEGAACADGGVCDDRGACVAP